MKEIIWSDVTTRSQDAKIRKESDTFVATFFNYKISIHRDIQNDRQWLFTCNELNAINFVLGTDDINIAKERAIIFFERKLRQKIIEIQEVINTLKLRSI